MSRTTWFIHIGYRLWFYSKSSQGCYKHKCIVILLLNWFSKRKYSQDYILFTYFALVMKKLTYYLRQRICTRSFSVNYSDSIIIVNINKVTEKQTSKCSVMRYIGCLEKKPSYILIFIPWNLNMKLMKRLSTQRYISKIYKLTTFRDTMYAHSLITLRTTLIPLSRFRDLWAVPHCPVAAVSFCDLARQEPSGEHRQICLTSW